MQEFKWTKNEKPLARQAFDKAYEREMNGIAQEVRSQLAAGTDARVIWRVHEYLSEKREEMNQKYDYRYSVLVSVFGRLLAEGHLHIEDLEGLREDKMERIQSIAAFIREQ